MIRRFYLYQPMTADEAAAATLWSEKLTPELPIVFRPSPEPMRLLLFDCINAPDRTRRHSVRVIGDPVPFALAAIEDAVEHGGVTFNLNTDYFLDMGRRGVFADTDVVFTAAFPNGDAVAWFDRVAGGIEPGIVHECVRQPKETRDIANQCRAMFLRRQPLDMDLQQQTAIERCEELLAAEPSVGCGSVTSR